MNRGALWRTEHRRPAPSARLEAVLSAMFAHDSAFFADLRAKLAASEVRPTPGNKVQVKYDLNSGETTLCVGDVEQVVDPFLAEFLWELGGPTNRARASKFIQSRFLNRLRPRPVDDETTTEAFPAVERIDYGGPPPGQVVAAEPNQQHAPPSRAFLSFREAVAA